jgi:hypothetical protein
MNDYRDLLNAAKPKFHTPSIPQETYERIAKQIGTDSERLIGKWIRLAVEKMVEEMETGVIAAPPPVTEQSEEVRSALHLFKTIRGSAQKGIDVLGGDE